jgi:hypothetical protein
MNTPIKPLPHSPAPWVLVRNLSGNGHCLLDGEGHHFATITLVPGIAQSGDLLLIAAAAAIQEKAVSMLVSAADGEEGSDAVLIGFAETVRAAIGLPPGPGLEILTNDDDIARAYLGQLRALVPPRAPEPDPEPDHGPA